MIEPDWETMYREAQEAFNALEAELCKAKAEIAWYKDWMWRASKLFAEARVRPVLQSIEENCKSLTPKKWDEIMDRGFGPEEGERSK